MSLGGGFNIPKKEERPDDFQPGGGVDYTLKEQAEEQAHEEELRRQSSVGTDSGMDFERDDKDEYNEEEPITSMSDFDRTRELNRARGGRKEEEDDQNRTEFERYKLMHAAQLMAVGVQSYESKVKQNDISQGTNALDGILGDMNNRIDENKNILIDQKDFKRVENSLELLSVAVFLLYSISWLFKITIVLAEFAPIFNRGAIGLIQGTTPFIGKTKRWRSVYQSKIMDPLYMSERQNPITFLALIKRLLKEETKLINKEITNFQDAKNNLEYQAEQVISRVPELSQYWNSNRPSEK